MKDQPFDLEMKNIGMGLSGWLSIQSESYSNVNKYPGLSQQFIHLDKTFTRVNDKFLNEYESNGIPSATSFWFKQNNKYIYYFENKDCVNALGRIYLDEVKDINDLPSDYGCFSITERKGNNVYKICADTNFTKKTWLCKLQDICKVDKSAVCGGKKDSKIENPEFKINAEIQPMILIPLAANNCNEQWDYLKKGIDWQCKCIEGS